MAMKNFNVWTVDVVTPSNSLISKFDKYDKTKSSASKRRSFNRARKWISDLLRRPFKIPENDKLRHIDITLALEDMTNCLAMPGGINYEEYLKSCLALPIMDSSQTPTISTLSSSNGDDNVAQETSENQNEE